MSEVASRFNTQGNVTLDANGDGTLRFAPTGEKWEVDRVHVRCSSRVSEAQCRIYLAQQRPDTVIDGTYSGSSGDTTDTRIYLEDGQPMFIEWTGGDPGATATATVSGWKSTPAGGFRAVH